MYHQHFDTINSTQIYLKENLEKLKRIDPSIVISASVQTEGLGRSGHKWDSYPNSIAMSFTLKPHPTPSLTPLEIGVLVIEFLQQKFSHKIFLKWPNDLLTARGKKCGGILSQYMDEETVIVGLGLNLGKLPEISVQYPHGLGNVEPDLEIETVEQEQLTRELYQFILAHRYPEASRLLEDYSKLCYHMNMEVFIFDNNKDNVGIFKGVGANGEALLEINGKIHSFYSSSLTILG